MPHAKRKQCTEKELANIFQNIARGGLWSPWSGTPRPQAAPPSWAVFLRQSDLFPESQDLKERYWEAIRKAPRLNAIVILSMINGLLTTGAVDASLHALLNENFLQKGLKERVLAYKPGGPASAVVFNRVGCLHLIRHLLLYGSDSPASGTTPQTKDVGELVLLANEFLCDDQLEVPPEASDLDVAAMVAPTWDIYNPRDLAYAMSRMHTMLREILPGDDQEVYSLSKAAGIVPEQITIDSIPLVDFLTVVFGLYSHGRKITTDVRSALFDIDQIFKEIGPEQLLPQFMHARSLTPSEFRKELGEGGEPSQEKFFQELESRSFIRRALVEFRRRPLLMLDGKHAVILDLGFLADLLTAGVYYTIFDSLPTDRRKRFREMWGRMFELYAVGLLQEAYPEVNGLVGHLRANLGFPGGQIDALLDFANRLLVFEVKSSLLTEGAKRQGNSTDFERDVSKKFVRNEMGKPKGVTQLANACRALRKGLVDAALACASIYPVLVSDEPACEALCFNSYLNGIFKSELGEVRDVRPLSVMSVNEFEEILGEASAGRVTWFELLDTRFDHDNVTATSVHQALYGWLRSKGLRPVRNEARRAKFEKASAEILRRYRPRVDNGVS